LFYESFRSQLKKNHFTEYRYDTDPIPICFRDDIKPMPDLFTAPMLSALDARVLCLRRGP
jgi:hypothetical protein